MLQHSDLQDIIEKIYWVNDRFSKSNSFEETGFELHYTNLDLKKIVAIKDFVAYRLADEAFDSIFAIGNANPCDEAEIEDYMLTYLDVFFDNDTSVDEMSRVMIDDMSGIEIFANTFLADKEYSLYSLYLSDGKDAYLMVSLVDSTLSALNTELFSLSRSFVRSSKKNKHVSKLTEILTEIDKKLNIDDPKVLHQMVAVNMKYGEIVDVSLRLSYKDSFVDYDFREKYKSVSIKKELNDILKLSKNVDKLEAFVISTAVSATPSITYYDGGNGSDEDDSEPHYHHNALEQSYSHHNEASVDMHDDKALTSYLIRCAERMSLIINDDTKYGMIILIREKEFIDFAAYYSYGGAYIPVEILFDDDPNNSLQMTLMDIITASPKTNNDYSVTEMVFDSAKIRSNTASDKEINVSVTDDDIYFDLATDDIDDENLSELATAFYKILNEGEEAISSITVNLDIVQNKAKSSELVMAKTFDGYKSLLYVDDEVKLVEKNINKIINSERSLNTAVVKIYPAGKLSIKYIYN